MFLSGMVSGAMNSIWQRSKTINHRVNATKFHRAAVTAIREKAEHIAEETADLLGHHRPTADRLYHIQKKEQNAVLAAAEVGAVMRSAAAEKPKKDAYYIDDNLRKRWSENETAAIAELFAGIEFTNTKHLEDSESQNYHFILQCLYQG